MESSDGHDSGGHDSGGQDGGGHDGEPLEVPESITCVDCGGICHLLTTPFEDADGAVGFRPGDVVAYRCSDCLDRWDIVVE